MPTRTCESLRSAVDPHGNGSIEAHPHHVSFWLPPTEIFPGDDSEMHDELRQRGPPIDTLAGADDLVSEAGATPNRLHTSTKRDFESSSLYKAVYSYVEGYMSRYDMSHDFNHVLRVLALAKHILAKELEKNPWKKLHKQAIILAALLHDVGDKKYIRPGEDAEMMITDLLTKSGCPPRFVAKVCMIVEHVSYSSEVKRPQLVKAILGAHPELAIVQDADRLDAIGAVGIARCFAFGAAKGSDRGLQGGIDHFVEKLEKIEGMMKTETGKELARQKSQRVIDFREWWEEETTI